MVDSRMLRAIGVVAIAFVGCLTSASPAHAALTYYFRENNSGGIYSESQAWAKVTLTNVTDFTGTTDGVKFVVETIVPPAESDWSFHEFALNVIGAGTIAQTDVFFNFDGDSSFNEAGAELAWYNGYDAGHNMDGFGSFEYGWAVSPSEDKAEEVDPLIFYIANKSETDFQENSTIPPGNRPRFFSVHIDTEGTAPDTWYWGTSSTTPPDNEPPPGVPEPTSLAIWALGMVAAGFGARRMRKQK